MNNINKGGSDDTPSFIIITLTRGGSNVPSSPDDVTDIGHMTEWNGNAALEAWPE